MASRLFSCQRGFSCAGSGVRIRADGILAAMRRANRRWMLGIGAALLIGGWGMTRYAHERLMTYPTSVGERGRLSTYSRQRNWDDSGGIFAGGVVMMAVGAGLLGFAIPPLRSRSDERKD